MPSRPQIGMKTDAKMNDEQKKVMEDIFELNDKKEKQDVVNVSSITFKNANELFERNKEEVKSQDNNETITDNNKLPIAINNKENVFTKILKAIKNFFHIKSK